jgi:hypothetical protein
VASAKLPSFQFYPGDWLKDPALRRCSKSAKGVWIDIVCLSFECEERGVFQTSGMPWPDEDIAGAVGGDIAENLRALTELLSKGVCSRNQSGAVFCRRVVRDEQKRRLCSEAGKAGGGNPALNSGTYKGGSKGDSKGRRKGGAKASSSTSSSSSELNTPLPPELLKHPEFQSLWDDFVRHRIEKKDPLTPTAMSRCLKKLEGWGPDRAVAAMKHSLSIGWTGIFEDKHTKGIANESTARRPEESPVPARQGVQRVAAPVPNGSRKPDAGGGASGSL